MEPEPVVQLSADEDVGSRSFAASTNTLRDAAVMRGMLTLLRSNAHAWFGGVSASTGVHVREPGVDGCRNWVRIPDRDALLAAPSLAVVGFFGQARQDVSRTAIDELETGIVKTLETIAGVLCYFDLELPAGGYGNLILCTTPTAVANVHGHRLHRRAVELTPRHYRSVRLHTGAVPGAFLSDADLVVERTRYYDFDCTPAWLAVRDFV